MTFEEAKKILEKEGFYVEKATRPCAISEAFTEYEDPSICKAMQVVSSAGYFVCMEMSCFDERKARLKKEHEKHANAPVSGKEKAKKGNPALEEAASQFNDALLDEQAKEIECLRDKCKKLVDILDSVRDKLRKLKAENSRIKNSDLNLEGLIYATRELKEKNKKIEELTKEKTNLEDQITVLNACKEHNDKIDRKQIKRLGKEIAKLNSIIHNKNAVLSDVAEELRLTKIREKNLAELGLKYVGENEKLKKKLADKIVDEIDARALKSAESALAYKEKVIAEKDEVIADLGKELAEAKKLNTAKILDINAKCMRAARESINDVFESYAAKYAKSTLDELKDKAYESFNAKAHKLGLVGSKDGNGIIDQMVGADFAEEGTDLSGVFVLCGKDFIDALKNVKDVWQE